MTLISAKIVIAIISSKSVNPCRECRKEVYIILAYPMSDGTFEIIVSILPSCFYKEMCMNDKSLRFPI